MDNTDVIVDLIERKPVPLDTLFDVLRAERRRHVLTYLQMHESPVALADLAHEVATHEVDETPSSDTITRIHASLHHCHLPKLADANLIEYDRTTHTVNCAETITYPEQA